MRTCAHPRCTETIAGHELACGTHWKALPVLLRNRIWRNYRRNPGGKAHVAAVGAARAHWWKQISESEIRCHNCRTKSSDVLIEETTGQPACLTCLGPALAAMRRPGAGLLRCPRCRRDVIALAAIGDGAYLCCECQELRLAA